MIGGVAEGLSRHFDIDPLLIRVAFFALTFFGGSGIWLYVIAWLAIPEDGKHDSALSRLFRADPRRVMGAGLVFAGIVGLIALVSTIGFTAPNPWPLLVVSVLALGAVAIFGRRGERPPPPPWPTPGAHEAWPPTGGSAAQTWAAATDTTTDSAAAGPDTAPTPTAEPSPRAWWQRPAESGSAGSTSPPPPPFGAHPPPPPPPPRAKKERSHLFGITMAASAIAVGVVWVLDRGPFHEIVPTAYPATVLAVTAIGLLVGTVFGRSRLLIAVGIVASIATAATAFLGPGPYGESIHRPPKAAAVESTYHNGVGRLVVHLEDIADPRQLDGTTVHIDEHIGELQVIVPSTMPVRIDAHVDHGEIAGPPVVQDLSNGEQRAHVSSVPAGGSAALVLDLELDYGQITITQYDCHTSSPRSAGLETNRTLGGTDAAPACP
jgi:phage shock protein PspC (stress-responsive transcriptional regulator)